MKGKMRKCCCFGSCSREPDPYPSPSPIPEVVMPEPNTATSSYITATSTFTPTSTGGREEEPNLKMFFFRDLEKATENFNPQLILGEGGFGKVYKGWVDHIRNSPRDPRLAVAIKRLNSSSGQGFKEWVAELNFLGNLADANLVKLLGYCWHEKELLLVYEFMERGNLENHLFRSDVEPPLSWKLRLSIATGAARGLAFLHALEKPVIYRDFKASNILLDSNYTAKLSDFGMARMGPSEGNSHVSTMLVGTPGYVDPHYYKTGKLHIESDVYGFGLVLLELLTGLRVVHLKRPEDGRDWFEWLKSHKKNFEAKMDQRIRGQYSTEAMLLAVELVLKCIAPKPKNRPSMRDVLHELGQVEYCTKRK